MKTFNKTESSTCIFISCEPHQEKTCVLAYAKKQWCRSACGTAQSDPRFVIRFLDSITPVDVTFNNSSL